MSERVLCYIMIIDVRNILPSKIKMSPPYHSPPPPPASPPCPIPLLSPSTTHTIQPIPLPNHHYTRDNLNSRALLHLKYPAFLPQPYTLPCPAQLYALLCLIVQRFFCTFGYGTPHPILFISFFPFFIASLYFFSNVSYHHNLYHHVLPSPFPVPSFFIS